MAVALAGLLVPASLGSTLAIGGITVATASGLTLAGTILSSGLTLLATSALAPNAPSPPTPQASQQNFENGVGPRIVHIGYAKIGGQKVLVRGKEGKLFILLVQGHGQINERTQHFLDGRTVTLDASGYVQEDQYQHAGVSRVKIPTRLGVIPETYYSEIEDVFTDWDDTHRLDGLSTALLEIDYPPISEINSMFPNRFPKYNSEIKGISLFDPRTSISEWSENPALAIRHYLASEDGMNSLEIDDNLFSVTADNCDVMLPTQSGLEPKYRIGGTYRLTDSRQSVLQSMLNTCDGELYITPEGKWGLTVGGSINPTVSLEAKHILSVEAQNGVSSLEAYTTLKPTYTDRTLGYISESIDPWVDQGLVVRYGTETVKDNFDLTLVPSHSQARRLSKRRVIQDNPIMKFTIKYNLHGLKAYGERYINVDIGLEEFGIDYTGPVKVDSISLSGGGYDRSDSITSVLISCSVIDAGLDDFTVEEEGDLPVNVVSDDRGVLPLVQNFAASPQGSQSAQNAFTAGISAAWDAPSYASLTPLFEYSVADSNNWQVATLASGATSVKISGLVDGALYDVRFAWVSAGGSVGSYVNLEDIEANASTSTPSVPTDFTVTDLTGGSGSISVTASASADNWKTNIYRDSSLILSQPTNPEALIVFTDPVGAGSYTYEVEAENISGKKSTKVATSPANTIIT